MHINTEDMVASFFQYVAGAVVGSTTIRCFPYLRDIGVVVIKGVVKSAGVGKELYNLIKVKNTDKKPYWAYSFPYQFAGKVKSPNTNIKVEVRLWKYVGNLLKGGLIVGEIRRTVEMFDPAQKNQSQNLHGVAALGAEVGIGRGSRYLIVLRASLVLP